jgi:hypothetical protein
MFKDGPSDTKQQRAGDHPLPTRKSKKLSPRKLAKAAAAPRMSPLQRDFEKRLAQLCCDARMAFMILRSTQEQLRALDLDYEACVAGTRNAKSLAEMIETAEWRFAEIVLRGGRDPAYRDPVDFRFR